MFLAFYKVDNSMNYERHTFDHLFDSPGQIRSMLSELSDGELRIYNLDDVGDVDTFVDDYNDEDFDGGWWCVLLKQ